LDCPALALGQPECHVALGLACSALGGSQARAPTWGHWHLGYRPLRWVRLERHEALGLACQGRPTRLARHVARPSAWAALHVRLRQDPMVMARCQDPIRLGPTPRPNGNGFCGGPKFNGSCLKTQFA
jgi:hypothetical protein